ncbi:trypsin-like serine peptidase [Rhizosaccharibacter radicis]|uniref:Trypsin-like peptidase domain-containing protein n=1 Tax=Rhizosaccharibacter radicis TaxID=2782605 RepID=A0ABT1VY11_9PROT|nr:trypsin-like peptidase domain-containing protein [Acetobacteraceae bacterium KSS12]
MNGAARTAVCGTLFLMLLLFGNNTSSASPLPLPGVSAADRRREVDIDSVPWRSLGRVQTELGGRCTGFLVAPRVVMTAAHCLFVPRTGHFLQPSSVHVLMGYRRGVFRAHARAVRFVIPAAFDPRRENAGASSDRAALLLDRAVGDGADLLGEAESGSSPPPTGAAVMLGGYGQDRDELAVADPACHLVGRSTDGGGHPVLLHDCEATRGTSGAPLLWRAPDGRWRAIGVQIEAVTNGAGGIAAPLDDAAAISGPGPGRSVDR